LSGRALVALARQEIYVRLGPTESHIYVFDTLFFHHQINAFYERQGCNTRGCRAINKIGHGLKTLNLLFDFSHPSIDIIGSICVILPLDHKCFQSVEFIYRATYVFIG